MERTVKNTERGNIDPEIQMPRVLSYVALSLKPRVLCFTWSICGTQQVGNELLYGEQLRDKEQYSRTKMRIKKRVL